MWPFKKKARIETKAILGTSDSLGAFLIFGTSGSAETPASALSLYEKSTSVSVPINMVAEAFASITPVIKIGDKLIRKHPLLELLQHPSPFFTQDLFFEALGKYYLITGETEVVALGGVNRPPLELQPISPRNLNPMEGQGGLAINMIISGNTLAGEYKLMLSKKRVRYLDGGLRELKQIRNFSTKKNSLLRGQSPLLAASAEARQHIKGNEHNNSLLTHGGRMSAIFHFKSDLNTDDFDETKKRVLDNYAGSSNAGKIIVTSGEQLELHELGINNKDMDFAKLQETAKMAVALQYKVPLPLIMLKAATFKSYPEAKLALYDDAVLPLADRVFAGLTDLLMPRYGFDSGKAIITYDKDQITALAKRRNEELKLRKELNLESTNELRIQIGLDAVDGGDKIMVPGTLVPLGTDINDNNDVEPTLIRDDDNTEELE